MAAQRSHTHTHKHTGTDSRGRCKAKWATRPGSPGKAEAKQASAQQFQRTGKKVEIPVSKSQLKPQNKPSKQSRWQQEVCCLRERIGLGLASALGRVELVIECKQKGIYGTARPSLL